MACISFSCAGAYIPQCGVLYNIKQLQKVVTERMQVEHQVYADQQSNIVQQVCPNENIEEYRCHGDDDAKDDDNPSCTNDPQNIESCDNGKPFNKNDPEIIDNKVSKPNESDGKEPMHNKKYPKQPERERSNLRAYQRANKSGSCTLL